jgi:hypothetical protein
MADGNRNEPMTALERGVPLSRSRLWRLQRAYFAEQGVAAWSGGAVPHYVTSSPVLAATYARLLLAWLRDLAAAGALAPGQPVHVLELGAGSGRFAYHCLRRLLPLLDASPLAGQPVVYVMSDFGERTLEFWRGHPQLAPWVAAGRLDFALFDGERDAEVTLLASGRTLAGGPLAVIANYVFDGLIADAFSVQGGVLHEGLVTLRVPTADLALPESRLLERVEASFEARPARLPYYDDPALDGLLAEYQRTLADTHVLLPVGGLRCLRALRRIAGERLLLLSADKGYHRLEDLLGRGPPGLALHGSVSLMVNYDAFARVAAADGGALLGSDHRHTSLDVCALLFGPPGERHPETRLAFAEASGPGSPDDFYMLRKLVTAEGERTPAQILAALRWSGWDSRTFMDLFPRLLAAVEQAPLEVKDDLRVAARRVWDNHFHLGEATDVAFALGLLHFALGDAPAALAAMQDSLRLHGPTAATYYNLAMAHQAMHQPGPALAAIDAALALTPGLEAARALRIRLLAELRRLGPQAGAT